MGEFEQQTSLIEALRRPEAYGLGPTEEVQCHETHISFVFLAGEFAYKIKKAIQTPFLDYSTLAQRKHYCELEVMLNRRYAAELYLDVVPIGCSGEKVVVGADAEPLEYAVRMYRFASDRLMSEQLNQGAVTVAQIRELAVAISRFHQTAEVARDDFALGWHAFLVENTAELFQALKPLADVNGVSLLKLHEWSNHFLQRYVDQFTRRSTGGFIRACHGDLHTENVVKLAERLVPFDGIEFSDSLRWIDVLSDVAFLAMDLRSRHRSAFAHLLLGVYLEQTGDYAQLELLRWYQFYRCLVRAMVDVMRSEQNATRPAQQSKEAECGRQHLQLAQRLIQPESVGLWLTYGLSGSGKSTVSERYMMTEHAIRVRSDVERKRMYGLNLTERPSEEIKRSLYSAEASRRVYDRLLELARSILDAGYSVVVDATFLKRSQREPFIALATELGVPWQILHCDADAVTLEKRLRVRSEAGEDPSDADIAVLRQQQQYVEGNDRLTKQEREHTVTFSL